jgi:hypothetical protein
VNEQLIKQYMEGDSEKRAKHHLKTLELYDKAIEKLELERYKTKELQNQLSYFKIKAINCVNKVRNGLGAGGHGSGMFTEIEVGGIVLDAVQDCIDDEF